MRRICVFSITREEMWVVDQKSKDILKGIVAVIFCIAGSILFLNTYTNIFGFIAGILFAFMGVVGVVRIVQLSITKEKSPEEIAAEVKEKLVDVPKLKTLCEVSIYRPSSFLGAANFVVVYLHDFEVGRLKNGKTLSFSTEYATNEMKIYCPADGNLIEKTFPAVAGGSVQFVLNYSKGTIEQR